MDLASALSAKPTGIIARDLNPYLIEEVNRRYEFLSPLGGGCHSGTVWKAIDRASNSTIAIRLFRPQESACTASDAIRLQRRLHPTVHLLHPNIVRTNTIKELGNNAFLVAMEFVDGPSLTQLVEERGDLPLVQAVESIIQIGEALAHAHNRGVFRHHLSPGQIVFPSTDRVILMDWGLTHRPDVRVSPHCLAPEATDSADHHADIYLLGVLAYFMLTGTSPFSGTGIGEVIREKSKDPLLSCRLTDKEASRAFDQFFRRTVRLNPFDRYSSMTPALADLSEIRVLASQGITGNRASARRSWSSALSASLHSLRS